jgi:hypothetical protein
MIQLTRREKWIGVACLAIGAGLAMYLAMYVWRRIGMPGPHMEHRGDFSYFYTAAQAMRNGQDIYLAQPPDKGRPGYIYPPLIAFLYQPLTFLPIMWAARVSLLVNLLAAATALVAASKAMLERFSQNVRWPLVAGVAVAAAILSFDKIKSDLQMLQTNSLVIAGIALGLLLLDRAPLWAGCALGFSMNIKYQAVALLVYLVLRRKWKAVYAMVGWTLFWAYLPAASVGLPREITYLAEGFSGILRIVGIPVGKNVANIEPLASTFSVSVTSAVARVVAFGQIPLNPLLVAGCIAALYVAILMLLYRRQKIPTLAWPTRDQQTAAPWNALVAAEWTAVMMCVLAFSPQTNTRHLILSLLANTLGVSLALLRRGPARASAIAGLVVIWMGLNLPPGNRDNIERLSAAGTWHFFGGPSFALLAGTALLVYAALVKSREGSQTASPPAMASAV